MEFAVQLGKMDYFRYLMNASYSGTTRFATGIVSFVAAVGATVLTRTRGTDYGIPMLALAVAFLIWTPASLYVKAGHMVRRAKRVMKLHYELDDWGLSIQPDDGQKVRVGWTSMLGAVYTGDQIVLYSDKDHVYILPRKALDSDGAAEEIIRNHLQELSRI